MPRTPPQHVSSRRGRCRPSATPSPARLLEESAWPDMPALFRRHLRRSVRTDIALTRLRILGLRLSPPDVARLPELRLCVAHPRAAEWEVEVHRALLDPSRRRSVRGLVEALIAGRIAVRAAPLRGWSPDFSVFHDGDGPRRALVGSHWLERPHPERGPVIGVEFAAPGARALARRFGDVWRAAYDITPALVGLLGRTLATTGAATAAIDTDSGAG